MIQKHIFTKDHNTLKKRNKLYSSFVKEVKSELQTQKSVMATLYAYDDINDDLISAEYCLLTKKRCYSFISHAVPTLTHNFDYSFFSEYCIMSIQKQPEYKVVDAELYHKNKVKFEICYNNFVKDEFLMFWRNKYISALKTCGYEVGKEVPFTNLDLEGLI